MNILSPYLRSWVNQRALQANPELGLVSHEVDRLSPLALPLNLFGTSDPKHSLEAIVKPHVSRVTQHHLQSTAIIPTRTVSPLPTGGLRCANKDDKSDDGNVIPGSHYRAPALDHAVSHTIHDFDDMRGYIDSSTRYPLHRLDELDKLESSIMNVIGVSATKHPQNKDGFLKDQALFLIKFVWGVCIDSSYGSYAEYAENNPVTALREKALHILTNIFPYLADDEKNEIRSELEGGIRISYDNYLNPRFIKVSVDWPSDDLRVCSRRSSYTVLDLHRSVKLRMIQALQKCQTNSFDESARKSSELIDIIKRSMTDPPKYFSPLLSIMAYSLVLGLMSVTAGVLFSAISVLIGMALIPISFGFALIGALLTIPILGISGVVGAVRAFSYISRNVRAISAVAPKKQVTRVRVASDIDVGQDGKVPASTGEGEGDFIEFRIDDEKEGKR